MVKWLSAGVLAVFTLFVSLWWIYKPVRVLMPEFAGVTCYPNDICVDDPARRDEASALYNHAASRVTVVLGSFRRRPQGIFCSTQRCFEGFGFRGASAKIVGRVAIVVSPKGWKSHYVVHEMIHHLQQEQLGSIRIWLTTPAWFVEGMAYALSDDPRPVLSEPWQGYREKFNRWYARIDRQRLWKEAQALAAF